MKIKFILASLVACIGITAQAQDTQKEEVSEQVVKTEIAKSETEVAKTEEAKQPKGKAIVQIFANFNAQFEGDKINCGFELDRSYIGYEYNFGKGLSVKGVLDIGKSSDVTDYHRIVYIKNAMLSWKKGGLTLNGGLISTTQFNFQEKFWGYRYVMKSFQDEYKFGSSADLGISASYKFADWISADAIIVNGEGYKKIQKGTGFNYGLGVTLTPVKGLQMRLYGGLNQSGEDGKEDIVNMAGFIGYKNEKFTIGAEYNHMLNASNKKGNDQFGYSVFASVNLPKQISLYARWDDLYSKDNWNISKDKQAAILGAEFKLGKYVKLAPNFRMNIPKAEGENIGYAAYVNCYFGF